MLRFAGGAVGTLGWGTYGGPGQFAERIEILSDKGKGVIITNAREVTSYTEEIGRTWTSDWNPISNNQSHVFNGYVGELRHFIDCVRNGKTPVPSIQDEAQDHGVACRDRGQGRYSHHVGAGIERPVMTERTKRYPMNKTSFYQEMLRYELGRIVGADRIITDEAEIEAQSLDVWWVTRFWKFTDSDFPKPWAIVFPENTGEVSRDREVLQ